ncbi:MAG: hypothetical protein CMO10_07510 [Thalassospira sp.]|nr:hypothetical protein [Thalassospira sp.]|tara:strand:- start:28038 stop:28535 length:498 start_codon:yes stop_codon:yes gene_type:complete
MIPQKDALPMTYARSRLILPALCIAMTLAAAPALAQSSNESPNEQVAFPEGYENGVHYGTFKRGGITEELYTSPAAIAAAKAGEPFPDGTVIMMEDHRDGKLYRYIAMEKRAEWDEYSVSGSWLFREWDANRVAKASEDGTSCQSCHTSQAENDFVFTHHLMLDD